MTGSPQEWNGIAVRRWLDSRVAAARADQIAAERQGREGHDECDKAAAEEFVCAGVNNEPATASQADFVRALTGLLERDAFIWRGVYNDDRFDRHVRSYVRKLARQAKAGAGFDKIRRYQTL